MRLPPLMKEIETLGITGDPDGEVRSICYHSRQCEKDSLFVAIPGLKKDGHEFIDDALARGARFIIHERDFAPPAGVTAIRVRDSRRVLGRLGKNFFGHPSASLRLIAVVGTNGKTTITYMLESILRAAGHPVGVLGTVDYRYGEKRFPAPNTTPESFEMQRILREMADHGVTHVVAEVSSHAIALRRVDDCAFDLGIFTNLTQDHLDYHRTMENYFQAKSRFFTEVLPGGGKDLPRRMILNGDDPWGRRIIRQVAGGRLTYGLDNPCDVTAAPFTLSLGGIEAKLRLEGEALDIASPLMGRFNLYNILASFAVALALNIPPMTIRDGLTALAQVPGRFEKVANTLGFQVYVDFAHTENSLRSILETARDLKPARLLVVFGAGGDRDKLKRPRMGETAGELADWVFLTSDNPRSEDPLDILRDIEKGVLKTGAKSYTLLPDRREAIAKALAMARKGDLILIAGKGHETYQEIKGQTHHFSDVETAREILLAMGSK